MNPFVKLQNLNNILSQLSFPDLDCKTHFTTANADATSRLDKETGDQIVLARPELETSTLTSGVISTVIFVLSRDLGAGKTPEKECAQYERLLEKAIDIYKRIQDLATSGCSHLGGLALTRYSVTPEISILGGWIGWSIELFFE